jgi:hypothetical protein
MGLDQFALVLSLANAAAIARSEIVGFLNMAEDSTLHNGSFSIHV